MFGKYACYTNSGKKKIKHNLTDYIKSIENSGAGEIILTSIDKERTFAGYDIDLIKYLNFVIYSVTAEMIKSVCQNKISEVFIHKF